MYVVLLEQTLLLACERAYSCRARMTCEGEKGLRESEDMRERNTKKRE